MRGTTSRVRGNGCGKETKGTNLPISFSSDMMGSFQAVFAIRRCRVGLFCFLVRFGELCKKGCGEEEEFKLR